MLAYILTLWRHIGVELERLKVNLCGDGGLALCQAL
jgi:ornithine carbamoyltransferase